MTAPTEAAGFAQDIVIDLGKLKTLIPPDDQYDAERMKAEKVIALLRELIRSLDRKGKST